MYIPKYKLKSEINDNSKTTLVSVISKAFDKAGWGGNYIHWLCNLCYKIGMLFGFIKIYKFYSWLDNHLRFKTTPLECNKKTSNK